MKKYSRKNFLGSIKKICGFTLVMTSTLLITGCMKKPVGGVDLEGIDIQEISSNQVMIDASTSDREEQNNQPDPNSFEGMEGFSIISVGDNIYHDNIIESGKIEDGVYNYDHIYSKISSEIKNADFAIVNQESVFCSQNSKPKGYPEFLAPIESARAMLDAGFDMFLMASNHTADNGKDIILNTMDFLNGMEGLNYIGINRTKEEQNIIKIIEREGIKIACLNYTELSNKKLNNTDSYMLNRITETRLKKDIAAAKEQADIVIVFPHWGKEYEHTINANQKKWTNIMCEAGADIIIGTHPHVIQPVEWVKSSTGHNTLVYYSLGNFVSRQIEGPRLLGAMAKIVLTKQENAVKIGYASVTPLMMHYEQNPSLNTAVYKLEDYTEELSLVHGVSHFETLGTYTHESILNLSQEILGDTKEVKIAFPDEY